MNLKTFSIACLLCFLTISSGVMAQEFSRNGVIYEEDQMGAMVCAWRSVILHVLPGRTSPQVSTVLFTEEVQRLGKRGFVRAENRDYIQVKTKAGDTGWVNANFFVPDGGPVVLTDNATIFKKPQTSVAVTNALFYEGEILILTDFRDNWVKLTSERKERTGWIKGYEILSLEETDLEAAVLLQEALAIESPSERRVAIQSIAQSRDGMSIEMANVISRAAESTYDRPSRPSRPNTNPNPEVPYYPDGEDDVPGNFTGNDNDDTFVDDSNNFDEGSSRSQDYLREKVVDSRTGDYYYRIIESGTVQPVKAKKPKSIYYAYHKSVPIGESILLEVPGTGSFVQLEVVARLRADNPNVVGLGGELIKKVFGEVIAKNINRATIIYPEQ
ncbi:MAG: hypothetical protein AAF206_24295 [Bacteroidota bacterium]